MEQIKLNTIPSGVPSVCHISQFDNTSRIIRCHLFNGSDPLTLTGSETIQLFTRKSDNSRAEFEIESTSGTFIDLVITSEMSDIAGDSECKFQITDSEKTIGTLNFKMVVEPDAYGDSLKTRSVSGPIATFETDLAEDLIKLDVDLEPIQDLHGYDNPWPAADGVNKLGTNRTLGTLSGNLPSTPRVFEYDKFYVGLSFNNYYAPTNIQDYNVDEHTVSLKTRFNTYGIAFPIKVAENTSYAINASSYNDSTAKLGLGYFDADGVFINYKSNIGDLNVITTPSGCVTAVVVVYDGSASDETVSVTDIFFNNPSTVTTFAPYANICPITGYTEANIGHTGKNWIKNIVAQGQSANHVLIGQSNPTSHDTHLKGGTYTISYKTRGSTLPSIYLKKQGVTGNVKLNNYDDKATFTVEDGDYRFWLYRSDGVNYEDIYEPQIELGSTATDYEPYESDSTPITVKFGQTVYKGKLYSEQRKVLVTHVCETFDGSSDEQWVMTSSQSVRRAFRIYFQNNKKPTAKATDEMLSSTIPLHTTSETTSIDNNIITCRSTTYLHKIFYIFTPPSKISTVEELRAFLSNEPETVMYPLDESFFIDLTQVQTADIEAAPIASFETTLARPLETSEHYFSCSQAEGDPTPDSPIPITGVSEITAIRTGKNLISHDGTMLDQTVYSWGSSDSVLVSYLNRLQPGTYRCSFKCRVLQMQPGKTSGNYGMILRAIRENGSQFNIQLREMKSNVSVGSVFEFSSTITLTSSEAGLFTNAYYYTGRAYNDGNPDYCEMYDFQIEPGSTATPYEPYNGETITVSLGGTYYGGKLVQSEDGSRKIVLDKAFTKINALTWSYVPSFTYFNALPTNIKVNSDAGKKLDGLMCDIYTNRTAAQAGSGDVDLSIAAYQTAMRIKHKAYTDVNSFIAAVGDHDIVYPLETPIEIDLPDGDPFTTLVGENNVYCNTGDTALTYYYNMVADPIRIPALVGTNNVYSDAGDVDVEYYTTLEGGND